MADIASNGSCPCLGRCDDPDSLFAFPTIANCCHSGQRPFPVEPSYQTDNCLGENWSECPRYKEAPAEDRTLKAAVVSYALKAVEQFPIPWEFVIIAVVVLSVLIGVWFLALRPKDVSQVDRTTPVGAMATAPPATSEVSTAAAQATTQTPTQTPTLALSPTTTPSRAPTLTTVPTSTRTPTPTPTPSPTPTAKPSMTPSQTPSLTPSLTAIPTTAVPTPTSSPTVTGTPLPVPQLSSPEDGQVFSAGDEITLEWQSVGTLPADAYYVITVTFSRLGETWYDETPWTKDTSWALSEHDYLVDLSDDGKFLWSVQAMLQTGFDAEDKPIGIAISPSSETWSLTWQRARGTPPPPPP